MPAADKTSGGAPSAAAPAYDVFNGDADGICALHQLRLAEPRDAVLVTGVKRDIGLLARVPLTPAADVTVLDISLDSNVEALRRLLHANARVRYIDHHAAGLAFPHPNLELLWDDAPEACTAILVDRLLGGRHRRWAIAAAFGDNLAGPAEALARGLGLEAAATARLAHLGRLLNYNAYGACVADLHMAPEALYRAVSHYADPFDFIADAPCYAALDQAYADDTARLAGLRPHHAWPDGAIYLLPAQAWARRIGGELANRLASGAGAQSFAVLTENDDGAYVVSVRSGAPQQRSACALCAQFAGGGGRKLAAGINHLPAADLARFVAAFHAHFALDHSSRPLPSLETPP